MVNSNEQTEFLDRINRMNRIVACGEKGNPLDRDELIHNVDQSPLSGYVFRTAHPERPENYHVNHVNPV